MNLSDAWTTLQTLLKTWSASFIDYLPQLLGAIAVLGVTLFVARLVQRLLSKGVDHIDYNGPAMTLIISAAKVVVVVVGAFLAMGILGLDKTVTSLLAGVGVIGLALGFAFQDIAANLMSGTLMAFKPPFRVGDHIDTNGHSGNVEEVSLRFTAVRTFEGQLVLLPNKDVMSNPVINYTTTGERRVDVAVGVAYGTDLEHAETVAKDAVATLDECDDAKNVDVFFTGFGGSSIDLTVRFWLELANKQSNYLLARSRAIVAINKAFAAESIGIPFPIRTLEMAPEMMEMLAVSKDARPDNDAAPQSGGHNKRAS